MKKKYSCFILLCFLIITYARPEIKPSENRKCGYEGCPKISSNKLNIHIIPHTHDDVGWLKTVDQYYYGSKTQIQKAGVQYILDSVVSELLRNPDRKFVYVESAFFFKWWKEQTSELQENIKKLVNEGRLEFVGGAWSMNDEASTHYQSIIDQFSLGLSLLNDTFGKCGRPKIGWQIDPFGHSREMASIFAQMGYDGLFFARLDYEDKDQRMLTKTAELMWHGSSNLGSSSDLFTGVLYNHYSSPPGFCFDILCSDDPIIDSNESPENNVQEKVNDFITYAKKLSKNYRTNNILVPMGDDFHYQDATMWYTNLDKLIKYVNELKESEVNIFYSTPSCYLKALHDSNIEWPTKQDDFFPYASDEQSYWTGYYTSRPTLKRLERVGNHFLQVCKQLTSYQVNQNDSSYNKNLRSLKEVMGIMQHHDAITGTEKQQVANDYVRLMNDALKRCSINIQEILNTLTSKDQSANFEFENCLNLNISQCEITESQNSFIVTLYNPLSHPTTQYIRMPVTSDSYEVKDHNGNVIASQIVPISKSVLDIPYRFSASENELLFEVNDIPLKGFKSFYVTRLMKSHKTDLIPEVVLINRRVRDLNENISIGNEHIKLLFDSNNTLSNIIINGTVHDIRQEFFYYEGNGLFGRRSGAYIFRPRGNIIRFNETIQLKVVRGALVEEVHQIINSWISQVIRIYKNDNHVEFEWLVGPIPINLKIGKEIITRFQSNIKSDGIFYTDSNGREMIKRKRNTGESLKEKIAGNYYPITTKIAIEDDNNRLAILSDRAQGGTSLDNGQIEIMLHRRLLQDDGFGVGEALNEIAYGQGLIAHGKHYLLFDSKTSNIKIQERYLQLEKLLPIWSFFSSAENYNFDVWSKMFINEYIKFNISLPRNVNFMTMEPWKTNQILLRFENIFEKNDDLSSNGEITFSIEEIFNKLNGFLLRETSLDGNQWIGDMNRLQFKINGEIGNDIYVNYDMEDLIRSENHVNHDIDDLIITLKPMQIRTFVLTYKSK